MYTYGQLTLLWKKKSQYCKAIILQFKKNTYNSGTKNISNKVSWENVFCIENYCLH